MKLHFRIAQLLVVYLIVLHSSSVQADALNGTPQQEEASVDSGLGSPNPSDEGNLTPQDVVKKNEVVANNAKSTIQAGATLGKYSTPGESTSSQEARAAVNSAGLQSLESRAQVQAAYASGQISKAAKDKALAELALIEQAAFLSSQQPGTSITKGNSQVGSGNASSDNSAQPTTYTTSANSAEPVAAGQPHEELANLQQADETTPPSDNGSNLPNPAQNFYYGGQSNPSRDLASDSFSQNLSGAIASDEGTVGAYKHPASVTAGAPTQPLTLAQNQPLPEEEIPSAGTTMPTKLRKSATGIKVPPSGNIAPSNNSPAPQIQTVSGGSRDLSAEKDNALAEVLVRVFGPTGLGRALLEGSWLEENFLKKMAARQTAGMENSATMGVQKMGGIYQIVGTLVWILIGAALTWIIGFFRMRHRRHVELISALPPKGQTAEARWTNNVMMYLHLDINSDDVISCLELVTGSVLSFKNLSMELQDLVKEKCKITSQLDRVKYLGKGKFEKTSDSIKILVYQKEKARNRKAA